VGSARQRKKENRRGCEACWAALAGPRGQPSWAACPFFLFKLFSIFCFFNSFITFAIKLQMTSNQLPKNFYNSK
jgi:hypothetical protein